MKFQIHAHEGHIDQVAIQRALHAMDDSALISLDPISGRLRVAWRLEHEDVVRALLGIGYRAEPMAASDCCGGCS
jgi:hypothetical protein